ncbi:hypothetical protein [Hyalangium versicolor]|uniref:hypothetical protein n=1 Tax=Hyalangium versicolor TaxID=2861190 RepID=UPI001CCD64F4|nr:hypothetical protein [Hyalangium versicolor]
MRTFDEYKGIEVSGRVVFGLVQAFGQFKGQASQLLLAEGIGTKGADGLVVVDPTAWYPLDGFMRAFDRTGQQMGDSVLHQIGVSTAKTAEWAPNTTDLKGVISQIDQGYHLNHRKFGKVMWDPATGYMQEGIGHYVYRARPDGSMEVQANNPYPCAFDKGLLFGAMRVLDTVGAIIHDDSHPCRKRGNKSCTYIIKG